MIRASINTAVGLLTGCSVFFFSLLSWSSNAASIYRLGEAACAALLVATFLALISNYSRNSLWFSLAATLLRGALNISYWIHCPNLRGPTLVVLGLIPVTTFALCVIASRTKTDSDTRITP